jgi:hypothetical protein
MNTPSRKPAARWLLAAPILLVAMACCLWIVRRRSSPAEAAPAAEPAAGTVPETGHAPPPPARGPARAPGAHASESGEPSSEHDLRAALRRLAETDVTEAPILEEALRPLLVPGANVYAVLERLKAGGLGGGAGLTLEELGALRLLAFAVLVFHPVPGQVSHLAAEGHALDGHALVVAILRALPDILEPARRRLAAILGGQRNENGDRILDASYAAELERLAEAHPELAALYHELLAGLLEDEGRATEVLETLYATDTDSPTLVGAALARWLETHAETAMAWAAETYDAEDASEELRQAISSAVARAAPVEEASQFLGQRAQRTMLAEFLTLGERDGGLAALDDEYWRLRILGDADERGRTMLVSGMGSLGTEALLAIAGEDPSLSVRAQAWTTLTNADSFEPSEGALQRLREAWDRQADPSLGVPPYGVISAASNFARRAGQGAPGLRAGALELLKTIALDPAQPERTRASALQSLRPLLSAQEFEQLRAGR